mgnify:CR=1 FL=1
MRAPEIATPTFEGGVKVGSFPRPEVPVGLPVDTGKYRDLLAADSAIESVLPKIKERMGKFFDIMGQLKTEINEQALYSPVNSKREAG